MSIMIGKMDSYFCQKLQYKCFIKMVCSYFRFPCHEVLIGPNIEEVLNHLGLKVIRSFYLHAWTLKG